MVRRLMAASVASLVIALFFSSSLGAAQSSLASGFAAEFDEPSDESISPSQPLAAGEVVGVNQNAGTITIRHKPIPGLFMTETMTMIFRVSDKSMLENVSAGDKVRFEVQRKDRSYVVVRIEHSN